MTIRAWPKRRRLGLLAAATMSVALAASLIGASALRAEEGCPSGQLPSSLDDGKCSKLSEYSRLPLDDSRPMVFEAIQDSPTMVHVQATGSITSDTPAAFETFLKSDDAKIAMASLPTIQLHSPGGDITAGIRLGEMIRKARLDTRIGRSFHLAEAFDNYTYKGAGCASACALAFLGGVGREYSDRDTYGFGPVGFASSDPSATDYVKRMGVDPTALTNIASAARIPVAPAQRMQIIFTPTQDSVFHAFDIRGSSAARFDFSLRTETYRGMVGCRDHEIVLYVVDREAAIPAALYVLRDTPAEFQDGAKTTLPATATYIKGKTPRDGVMLFKIKGLTAESFSDRGLSLVTIDKPADTALPHTANAENDPDSQMAWADRVTEFSFVISSKNARGVLPPVLKACDGS